MNEEHFADISQMLDAVGMMLIKQAEGEWLAAFAMRGYPELHAWSTEMPKLVATFANELHKEFHIGMFTGFALARLKDRGLLAMQSIKEVA